MKIISCGELGWALLCNNVGRNGDVVLLDVDRSGVRIKPWEGLSQSNSSTILSSNMCWKGLKATQAFPLFKSGIRGGHKHVCTKFQLPAVESFSQDQAWPSLVMYNAWMMQALSLWSWKRDRNQLHMRHPACSHLRGNGTHSVVQQAEKILWTIVRALHCTKLGVSKFNADNTFIWQHFYIRHHLSLTTTHSTHSLALWTCFYFKIVQLYFPAVCVCQNKKNKMKTLLRF